MKTGILRVPVLAFVVLISWSVASPIGSSPDDDFHLPSIWCAHGNKEGKCQITEESALVPSFVAQASDCYKRQSRKSASCQAPPRQVPHSSETLSSTTRFSRGKYAPVFYKVMNLLTGSDLILSATFMRVLNATLFCLLASAIYAFSKPGLKVAFSWMWLVCCVPMGVFLLSSNNPASWVIIGVGCLFGALMGFLQSNGQTRGMFAFLSMVSGLMALGSRPDAGLYVLTAILVAAVLAKRNKPSAFDLSAYFLIVLAVAALFKFFMNSQILDILEHGLGSSGPDRNPATIFWFNLVSLPGLWLGVLGYQALGWLDTHMMKTVYIGASAAFFLTISIYLSALPTRNKIAILIVLTTMTILPLMVLMKSSSILPENVQSRYLLPLLFLLVGSITYRPDHLRVPLPRSPALLIVIALSIAHSLALHTNIRRYVTGLDILHWNLNQNVEWWPWSMISPMTLWGIASLAFALMCYLLVDSIYRQTSGPP